MEAAHQKIRYRMAACLKRTELLIGRDTSGIEHGDIHVRMYGPISGGIVARGDEHRVALCNGHAEQIDRGFLNVGLAARQYVSAGNAGREYNLPRQPR